MPKTKDAPAETVAKKETLPVAIEAVLKRKTKGLNAQQIYDALKARGGACPVGKTPIATLQAVLSISNLKDDGKFVRVAKGQYALRPKVAATA